MFSKLPKLTTTPCPPLQKKIFGLSIFLFSQRLCSAEIKNGYWDRSINMTKTIEDGQSSGLPQASLISVAIKARAEPTCVFCRAAATKSSVAHLKGGLEGL